MLKSLEAMAIGKPVTLSDVRAPMELVDGSDNAVFIKAGDIDTLRNAIIEFVKDKITYDQIGHQVRNFATTNWSWARTIEKIHQLIVESYAPKAP